MLNPVRTRQFKKDYKLCLKRGHDMNKIKDVMRLLVEEAPLPPYLFDHPLQGNWRSFRECHIEPDWLMIYKIKEPDVIFARTGSHSDLFSG